MVLETVLGHVHTANAAIAIVQLKEVCRTLRSHESFLVKMAFSRAVVLYAFIILQQRAVADARTIQRMRRRIRTHRRRQDRQRKMLLLLLVSLFVNETTVPRSIWRRTRCID